MGSLLYSIKNSDYIGVFATASDRHVFVGSGLGERDKRTLSETLGVDHVNLSVSSSDLVGLFSRANSNGLLLSNIIEGSELQDLKSLGLDINIGVLDSGLNAIGNNIIANDRIAIVNPDYEPNEIRQIRDILGVEVVKSGLRMFKTVGASNILTNKGVAINNRSSDAEKQEFEATAKLGSSRTTANSGSIYLGLSAIANSRGVIAGRSTTGFELQRLMEGLDVAD